MTKRPVTRRSGAARRLRRLLAMIPWLAANDGPEVADVCERFGITSDELRRDLELLTLYVGVPPYTPERLFHITVERGRVFAHLTPALDRPLRLTPDEAIALVVAGRALAEVPGSEEDGPLARALDKLADVLGVDPDDVVDVDLGTASAPTLALLRQAVADRRQVELDYHASGSDQRQRRTVDPWQVVHEGGAWYLVGHDHLRGAARTFRVDRVLSARVLDQSASAPPAGAVPGAEFSAADDDPRVVLELADDAGWVVESYPVEDVEPVEGGGVRVTMAVTARSFLERLLLRLGPDARVVSGPPELVDAGADAAARVLTRYPPNLRGRSRH